jgi:hypothetical protein
MANCNHQSMCFSSSSGKKVEATFTGGAITSNAGVLLLKEIDQQYNWSEPDFSDNFLT